MNIVTTGIATSITTKSSVTVMAAVAAMAVTSITTKKR
jgi:hypothetical protein